MSSDPPQHDGSNGLNGATNGAISSTEYFQAIGVQADQVAPTANGAEPTGDVDDVKPVEEIESLCMNCHEDGITRLLLTKIPYFREIIIMSFSCAHCGLQNNEIQAAGSVQPKGTHYELRLTALADFARQVVKSDSATVKFVELDLEIPAGRGQLTNIEGLLAGAADDLERGQEDRRAQQPDVFPKVAAVIARARAMLAGAAFPFRVYVDDPAGNSWIQPDPRDGVGKWAKRDYARTPAQNAALGLADSSAAAADDGVGGGGGGGGGGATDDGDSILPDEVYSFPASCPGCAHPCTTHMKMVDIPHFQQVVLMSTVCAACGYRSNDVKTGGAVPRRGRRTTLRVAAPADLARDILKSEAAALRCPELALAVTPGTLGGRFTTVEGLLTQVRDDLRRHIFHTDDGGGGGSDGLEAGEKARWTGFFAGLDAAIRGDMPFTIVLEDPLASSYVQSLADDPAVPDAQMTVEEYTRTAEEEEALGLADMKVEGYEADAAAAGGATAECEAGGGAGGE